MAFMFTDLGGVIRVGKYTPEGSIPLGKGKEECLLRARDTLGVRHDSSLRSVPGFETITGSFLNTRDARLAAINTFREKAEAFLKGGA
jgi:hypothetical protein